MKKQEFQEFYDHKKPRKLMDQVRDVMRLKHYVFRTAPGKRQAGVKNPP